MTTQLRDSKSAELSLYPWRSLIKAGKKDQGIKNTLSKSPAARM